MYLFIRLLYSFTTSSILRKSIISFLFFITTCHVLCAQRSEKQFGLGTGWFYHDYRDAAISNESQSGSSISLLLFYQASSEKNRHHVQLLYAAPRLRSNYLLAKEQTGYLQYAYHRKLLTAKSFSFFGGGVIEIGGASRKYSEIGNSLSYKSPFLDLEILGIISPSFLVETTLGKDKLSLQMWVPFIGFIANNLGRLSDAKLTGLDDLVRMEARISYGRFFSERWGGRLDYQIYAFHLDKQFENYAFTSIKSFSHQLNLSLYYKFGGR